jgi:multidrug efflux pump subunit AcrA (membrane-fusion protein)
MTVIRVKVIMGALLCVLGLVGLGVGVLPRADGGAAGAEERKTPPPVRSAPPAAPAKNHCKVPSQRDGILVLVGTENKELRRLRAGDKVQKGQLLARLDDRLALDEVEIKESKVEAAKAEQIAAEKTRDEAKARWDRTRELQKRNVVSEDEVRATELTWERYNQEVIAKKAAVRQAQLELKSAKTILSMYEIHSPVTGVVQAIYKQRGEAVKALEPVFLIEYDDD